MRRILTIVLFAAIALSTFGEDVVFRAQAPAQVIVGRPFQMSYTVNQRAKDMLAPEFDGFDYIAGPYTSQSSSTSFVNGKRTSSFQLTYTYTLMAQKEGTFNIPPAVITVGSAQYTSNGVKITVLPEDQPQGGNNGGNSSQQQATAVGKQAAPQTTGNGREEGNIFVRTLVSRTKVYEQEAISLSYRLYVAGAEFKQFTNNMTFPDFTSFLQQKLNTQDAQWELENYNGRNYQAVTFYSILLYPQKSGDIQIDPAMFEAVLLVPNQARSRSIFDDFFNSYTSATRMLRAPGVTIHVQPLPAGKPASFAGGVGQFRMDAKLSSTEVKANEAVTLTLTVRGAGNMKLLKNPAVEWPEGFEQYDPKVTNNIKTSTGGMSGTRTVEYLAIPRAAGEYTIPSVEFTYFDTEKGSYQTLRSPEYTLHIARGAGEPDGGGTVVNNYVTKEDIKELGSDIRYISAADFKPSERSVARKVSFGSWQMLALYVCPLVIALLLFVVFRKRIRENADLTRVRYRQANSVARKRLKKAKSLIHQANSGGSTSGSEAFYEEIERAAMQYLSHRLTIPTAELNKDSITATLRERGVDEQLIARTNRVLQDAAFARYAPAMGIKPDELYRQTEQMINDLEDCKL